MKKLIIVSIVVVYSTILAIAINLKPIEKEIKKPLISTDVYVTTYTIDPRQTDSTPLITASGFKLHPKNPRKHKIIAVSRDLIRKFKFGQYVRLKGAGELDGIYVVQDLMNKRFKKRIDILINPKDKPTSYKKAVLVSI